MVGASPRVSNRIPEDFPDPDSFDPGRYLGERQEDLVNRWTWIPFGAGKHRCVGNAFALMQMKAIFSVILRDYEFDFAQPSESYEDDMSKMVIQLKQPCRVNYRRRAAVKVSIDRDLCQGHQMCQGEAPDVFGFDAAADQATVLIAEPGPEHHDAVRQAARLLPRHGHRDLRRLTPAPRDKKTRRCLSTRAPSSRPWSRAGSTSTARPRTRATGRSWPSTTPRTPPTAG